jgi:hypothetical protein
MPRAIKTWWLFLAFLSGAALAMLAEGLMMRATENRIEFSAPKLDFLSGKPLDRLKNAEAVPFDFQITLWSGTRNHVFRTLADRFVISYDLWEEKFSVNKMVAPQRSAKNLSATAAESWCLQQMALTDLNGLSPTDKLWARLEVRAEDLSPSNAVPFTHGAVTESGISLNGLLELLSRPPPSPQSRIVSDAGPVTLEALRAVRR